MKKYLYITFASIAMESFEPMALQAKHTPERHPNVLFVMADDLRPELGCYGVQEIHTPNIDRFAARAMVFRNAFCNAPVSGASRASLFTGMYPNYPARFTDYTCKACVDAPEAVPLSGWLTDHGYYTVSNGKVMHHIEDHANSWSEQPWRSHPDGYDVYWAEYNKWELWLNSESGRHINPQTMRGPFCEQANVPDSAYDDGKILLKTVRDLKRLRDLKQPFFLACGFWKPHLPFCAPKKYWDLYPTVSLPGNYYRPKGLPTDVRNSNEINAYACISAPTDSLFVRQVKTGYYACISYVDHLFGELMQALEDLDMADNTIVILLGDHGWDLGEHQFIGKHNLMDITTRVPLIIRTPDMAKGHTSSMAELIDLYPTICELCGIEPPQGQLDGKSLVPILQDPTATVKKAAYIQWQGGDDLLNHRFNYAQWDKTGHSMLFDHLTDPEENVNQVDAPMYSSQKSRLRKALKRIKKYAFRSHSGSSPKR